METLLDAPHKTQLIFLSSIPGFFGGVCSLPDSSAELVQITNPVEKSRWVQNSPIPVPQTLTSLLPSSHSYRGLTLVLTFLSYTSYHLSRKPISIVKVSSSLTPAARTVTLEREHGDSTCISPLSLSPAEPTAPQLLGLGPEPPQ